MEKVVVVAAAFCPLCSGEKGFFFLKGQRKKDGRLSSKEACKTLAGTKSQTDPEPPGFLLQCGL